MRRRGKARYPFSNFPHFNGLKKVLLVEEEEVRILNLLAHKLFNEFVIGLFANIGAVNQRHHRARLEVRVAIGISFETGWIANPTCLQNDMVKVVVARRQHIDRIPDGIRKFATNASIVEADDIIVFSFDEGRVYVDCAKIIDQQSDARGVRITEQLIDQRGFASAQIAADNGEGKTV